MMYLFVFLVLFISILPVQNTTLMSRSLLHVSNDWLVIGWCRIRAVGDFGNKFAVFVRDEGEGVTQWLPAGGRYDGAIGGYNIKIFNKAL